MILRRRSVMLLVALTVILSSVGCVTAPKPDLCTIVNYVEAQCTPTDPEKQEYDKLLKDMLGYTCLSPKDLGDMKKYIRNLMERLD